MVQRVLSAVVFMLVLMLGGGSLAEESVKPAAKAGTAKKAAKSVKGKAKAKPPKAKKAKATKPARKTKAAAPPAAVERPVPAVADITDLRHWSTPDYTRVAVTLNREAPFEKHEIAQSPGSGVLSRIYFDVNGARLGSGIKDITIADGLLKSARAAQYKPDTVRVVLDVDNIKDYKIFTFSDPFRIIVDVKGERRPEISALPPAIAASPPPVEAAEKVQKELTEPQKEAAPVKPAVRAQFKPGRIRRVVVDPGHGGKDPGAVGLNGLQEKDVVLSIALSVARKLREELGIDVVMTRSTDVFIELQERTAIANQVGADLFISIHANAALNRKASGIETYYLNLAKTEKAAQLAARENGTSLEKVSLLQAVLFDLMANYKLNDSAHLAEEVQKALFRKLSRQDLSVKNLGVKQGPFYVLVGATMPSVLVESAFISNPQEEAKLADPEFRELTADGIVDGLAAYASLLK